VKVRTESRVYTVVDAGDGGFLVSGHPTYCPTPTMVRLLSPITIGEPMVWPAPIPGRPSRHVVTSNVTEILPDGL
jgi:hypothetical protein